MTQRDHGSRSSGHGGRDLPDTQSHLVHKAIQAIAQLEAVGRDLLAEVRSLAPEAHLPAVAVPVSLALSGKGSRHERALDLVLFLREQIRESLLAQAAFERGRIYCLRCESNGCPHAEPPSPRAVFSGYGETGRPEWSEIAELLAARGDARLDRLYLDPHELVALTMSHDEVYERLLPVFGRARERYLILAQMVVGRFVPSGSPGASEPMSLTVQVARTGGDHPVIGVNLIGRPPRESGLVPPLAESVLDGLGDALRTLNRELGSLARMRDRGPRPGEPHQAYLAERCFGLLRNAARDLEHRTRVNGKRTLHARERSYQADRPTAKAFEDARGAADENVMEDGREHTVAVLGARGRVHFFTREGKHVTSVTFPAQVIRSRIAQKRWRRLPPADLADFRRRVRSSDEER
jgi:hypothetical protein